MDQEAGEGDERRIGMVLAIAQLLLVKRLVILRARVSQSIVIWMIGLDQNFTGPIATTRTSRDLRDELKRSFRRAKVRQRQTRINRNHANECHIRKVVSFGKHLRTDERIDASGAEVSQ